MQKGFANAHAAAVLCRHSHDKLSHRGPISLCRSRGSSGSGRGRDSSSGSSSGSIKNDSSSRSKKTRAKYLSEFVPGQAEFINVFVFAAAAFLCLLTIGSEWATNSKYPVQRVVYVM